MSRLIPAILLLIVVAWSAPRVAPSPTESASAASTAAPVATRFTTVTVILDADVPVAAWQVTLRRRDDPGAAASVVVGLGGAGAGPWTDPPRHDPAAFARDELILGAWHAGPAALLAAGRVPVAVVHLQVPDDVTMPFAARLDAAADADGRPIRPDVLLMPGALVR